MKQFETVRFGKLTYAPESVIHLPQGLVGLPELKDWLLMDMEDGLPLKWLQSLQRPDFAVPVADPHLFRDDYEVPMPPEVRRRIGADSAGEVVVLIIATVHPGGQQITGNMLAPLVIHTERRLGAQFALENPELSMRQEMDYFKFGLAVNSLAKDNGAGPEHLGAEAVKAENGEESKVTI